MKRFIAAFMDDCIKEITEIITGLNEFTFRSKGTVIRQPGWRILYPPQKPSSKNKQDSENSLDNQILPIVKNGDPVINQKANLAERQTRPPKLYTEATLLAAMETAGKAITFNALVIIFGFLVLLLSNFPPTRNMGIMVSLNMFTCFLGAITLLPAALNWIRPRICKVTWVGPADQG